MRKGGEEGRRGGEIAGERIEKRTQAFWGLSDMLTRKVVTDSGLYDLSRNWFCVAFTVMKAEGKQAYGG